VCVCVCVCTRTESTKTTRSERNWTQLSSDADRHFQIITPKTYTLHPKPSTLHPQQEGGEGMPVVVRIDPDP
jgi:hypothetical protein